MNVQVITVDYANTKQAQALIGLLDSYARDPMGGGQALTPYVKSHLVEKLSMVPQAFSLLAYQQDQAVGLANCFSSFSTFACKSIINIHDLMVVEKYRGRGISQAMLDRVEAIARERDCCKITLEVLNNNQPAQSAYRRFGFIRYQLDSASGSAEFWHKSLE